MKDISGNRRLRKQITTFTLLLVGILYGCANRVAPDGGPYDVTPPKYVKSSPDNKALNVGKKKIIITFDEYIQIKDIANKVIISPPQLQQPKILAIGKSVIVELADDLIPNTTYSLDFTDAIVDNNEGNPLENFSIAFSTGNEIDTMEIAGKVINIRNHEPMQGMLVGIHADSAGWDAFTDTTFLRMSRTGDLAQFVIRNIKQGSYRVYALKESDGNYRHDMATEGIAFLDSVVTTSSMAATRQDTIWVDSLTIDTIKSVEYTRYLPDDIVLMYYEPIPPRRFISKRERPDSMRLKLTFNALPSGDIVITPVDSIVALRSDKGTPPVYDKSVSNGEVIAFFSDPEWKTYRKFEVAYTSIDTLNNPTIVRDTISPKIGAKESLNSQKKGNRDKVKEQQTDSVAKPKSPLTLKIDHKGSGGIHDSIVMVCSLPIDTATLNAIELYNANDSILKPIKIDTITLMSGKVTEALISAKLDYETSYELYVDSLTFKDIYGNHLNETVVDAFKTSAKEEFSQLSIDISGVEGPFIGELLDVHDKPISVVRTTLNTIHFADLKPDKYAFRLIIDKNGNGVWDAGNYKDSVQPELVYYMPKILEVMKNWSVNESFSPLSTPLSRQKPKELIKNKPKATQRKDRNKEREEELKRLREGTTRSPMGDMSGDLGGMNNGGLNQMGGMQGQNRGNYPRR